tara:strand:- start:1925 stop:2605 length:681 start_codon:yes stop_codon:yes gene_type:complete
MLIKEIFDHLAQGELRTLAIGGMEEGGVLRHNFARIIPHINMGITEIYKRLPALEKRVDIQCDLSILEYKLHTRHTQSSGNAAVLYIMDTITEPFLGDVLKLESITGEVTNDAHIDTSIRTDYLSFTLPLARDDLLEVVYRAKLPTIDVTTFDIETAELDLPYAYLSALLNYIGMRMTTGMPAKEGISDSNTFLGRFEACIAKIHELGLVVNNDTTNDKATNNGWV